MKYGLALEGGGARGAYQIGAIKALIENGYEFSAICGTSIGAINGALVAQNDIDVIYDMWKSLSFKDLFDIDEERLKKAIKIDLNKDVIKYLSKKLGTVIKDRGIDTTRMKALLNEKISEEKLRSSNINFGLVTVCLTDRKAHELFINDIPQGELVDYIMASCNLPVFQRAKINDKSYMDGGLYDNCPVHMLESKGIEEVIAIRTFKRMRIRDYKNIIKRDNVKLIMIEPIDVLPSILNFDSENLNYLLIIGYYDAIKVIKKLDGYRYYVTAEKEDVFLQRILDMNTNEVKKIAKLLKVPFDETSNMKKLLLEQIIPEMIKKTKTKEADTYKNTIYALIEYIASKENIERFKVYSKFDELLNEVKSKINYDNKTLTDEVIYRFVNSL